MMGRGSLISRGIVRGIYYDLMLSDLFLFLLWNVHISRSLLPSTHHSMGIYIQ